MKLQMTYTYDQLFAFLRNGATLCVLINYNFYQKSANLHVNEEIEMRHFAELFQ